MGIHEKEELRDAADSSRIWFTLGFLKHGSARFLLGTLNTSVRNKRGK